MPTETNHPVLSPARRTHRCKMVLVSILILGAGAFTLLDRGELPFARLSGTSQVNGASDQTNAADSNARSDDKTRRAPLDLVAQNALPRISAAPVATAEKFTRTHF